MGGSPLGTSQWRLRIGRRPLAINGTEKRRDLERRSEIAERRFKKEI
jgi:hypothetical protein